MLVAASVALAAGIFAFSGAAAFTGSWRTAVCLGAVVAGLIGWVGWRWPIVTIDESAASRGFKIVSALATLVALVQLARLALFMVFPAQPGYSFIPSSQWEVRHSCLSAYFVAAQAADETPNVYDDSLYSLPGPDANAPRRPRTIDSFKIDPYEYPPPFLLVPRALRLLVPDFTHFRMLWFALDAGVVLLAMLLIARALGPTAGTRALLLAPLVWTALPTLSALQKGNVQLPVIALSMLGMLLFQRRHWAAGGALLAYATVSKLFPGMLVVYLCARRQWRAAAATAAWGVVFVLLALLDIGWAPHAAFLDHLPGVLGGEAFPVFRNPAAMAINFSIPGLVFKLKLFGVPGMSFTISKIIGWLYTGVAVWVTVLVGRRAQREDDGPLLWLAIIILATLRSPFLPAAYAAFPGLWLLGLIAATHPPTTRTLAFTLGTWVALNVFVPLDWIIPPHWLATLTFVPQAATVALMVIALRRAEPATARPITSLTAISGCAGTQGAGTSSRMVDTVGGRVTLSVPFAVDVSFDHRSRTA